MMAIRTGIVLLNDVVVKHIQVIASFGSASFHCNPKCRLFNGKQVEAREAQCRPCRATGREEGAPSCKCREA